MDNLYCHLTQTLSAGFSVPCCVEQEVLGLTRMSLWNVIIVIVAHLTPFLFLVLVVALVVVIRIAVEVIFMK